MKQLQQFLGMANYYRKFIKNFAAIASPLYALLYDNTIWSWDENCEKAFQDIKKALTSYPILRQPDMKQQFIINVDASNEAVAVLSQLDDQNNKYAIAYASKSFRSYEKHMSISEKEMAACVFRVNEFRPYIFGTKFKIVTDHNALKYLMSIKNPTGKLARWSLYLSQLDFEIVHRKGINHSNADYLSRPTETSYLVISEEQTISNTRLGPYEDEPLLYFLKYLKHRRGASRKQVNRLNKLLKYF